jgi:hypothetical protein
VITPLEGYFLYQAERPRTHAERQVDDARSADFFASLARGPAALRRIARWFETREPGLAAPNQVQGSDGRRAKNTSSLPGRSGASRISSTR